VWFCGVEQSGKTNTMLNCMGWAIDCAPGSIFYLMPTEDTSAKVVGGKIIPMLRQSKRLQKYLTSRNDDLTLSKITLNNGTFILPAHANSQSSTATWAARYAFGDEVDKYPAMSGKEADPITLIKKRNRTFKGRYKRFFSSTPAGMFIQAGMNKCQQVWEMHVCCPHCLEQIRMDVDHLSLPEGATADTISADDVGYACNQCGAIWDDHERERAIRGGRWHCRKGADVLRPATVGFHHRAWECLDISLHEIAVAWLKAEEGGVNEKTAWANGYEAVDYKEKARAEITKAAMLRFKDEEAPRNMVPVETAQLVLLADTQQSSFYYQVWAFGYAPDIAMHMVRHGIVLGFVDLEGLLMKTWLDGHGKEYRISCGMIDSGGTRQSWQKHSRTVEVYEWCSRQTAMIPIKGMAGRTGEMVSWKNVTTYPGTNKAIPGGLVRANLRVDLFKDELGRRLGIEPDDPGALSFHADIDEDFVKHYTAESRDRHGDWVHDRNKGRIDYWDCTTYALALRNVLKLRIPTLPRETAAGARKDSGDNRKQQRAARW